ncbi:sensor histidine kinase [Streptomyces sp. NBC_00503]|uniref:sensor histidine kinase n=1 Tax=Streptomyces sp. NBC_00503 TaxID=2903659 RepID=UPI002E81B3AE|nr:histidine kinase [Streptomyces sp. NBC_00503]WUD85679.1 histidine kinase [Streptomyces sp. NBC_00503]
MGLSAGTVVLGVADAVTARHVSDFGLLPDDLWVEVAIVGVLGFLLLFRRFWPLPVAAAVIVGDLLAYAPAALALAMFTVARQVRPPAWLWGTVGTASVLHALAMGCPCAGVASRTVSQLLGFVAVPALAGLYLRTRHELAGQIAEENRERAIAQERSRIAKEMHDVVAHRVSHMVLRAGAIEVAADRGTAWVAQEACAIADTGREAVEELHTILGVLSTGSTAPAPRAPQPTLENLPDLVTDAQAIGLPTTLTMQGTAPDELPPDTQRTVYRLVQEALTNAAKYAPGARTRVGLERLPGAVRLEIVNERPPRRGTSPLPSGGFGLIGMQERVDLLGGTFHSGATPEGGFRVQAYIPVTGPAHAPHKESAP